MRMNPKMLKSVGTSPSKAAFPPVRQIPRAQTLASRSKRNFTLPNNRVLAMSGKNQAIKEQQQGGLDNVHITCRTLLIGVTGLTGKSALTGFMESVEPSSATILTSRPDSTTATSLRDQGFNVLGADLDDKQSLHGALEGISAVYIHALSADASKADPKELERARRLISAMESADSVKHVVYNGSAGKGNGYAISQMKQKHLIEDLLMGSKLPSTVLQATLFREEFWKKYTRPGILKGVFSFALPPDKKLQVLSVKDMGKVAAASIAAPEEHIGKSIPLAGDELTPSEMCQLFGKVQGKEVAYRRLPAWPFWFLNRDLYNIIKFYTEVGYDADVAKCRSRYNLQTFEEFLVGTHWADETLDWPKL